VSTILFVDDHHAFRTVFAEVLRNQGHVVLEAGTTADADHIREFHPGPVDLLIVEAVLGTTNGIELANRLKTSYPGLPALYISTESPSELRAHRELPEAAPFLQKPFSAEEFCGKVEELLRQPVSPKDSGASGARGAPRVRTL